MRLLYVNPIATDAWNDDMLQVLESHKEPGTQVAVIHLEPGDGRTSGPFLPPIPDFYAELFRVIRQGEQDGHDGIMIGCAADPGLREATHRSKVPVFGTLQTGLNLAALLGRRICLLVPGHDVDEKGALDWHEETIRKTGIERDRITVRPVKVGRPADAATERLLRQKRWGKLKEEVMARFRDSVANDGLAQAKKAVKEDRAEVLLFACNFWAGLLAPVAAAVEAVVLDPVVAMLKSAERAITSCVSNPEHPAGIGGTVDRTAR